ncbi:MAG: RNA pyrophosphohydrolase [Alphaproteobacteria bacterium]|nr:RNA pyrophosphohydrolase [Alphaproteobacteria bacterium]
MVEKDNSEYIEVDGCRYRKNVGIIVFNSEGKVLFTKRNQQKITYGWQFPQGGVDTGETTDIAVMRELFEETGIKNAKIVYKDNVWRAYKFPAEMKFARKNHDYYKNVHGQIQKWFLIEYFGTGDEITIPNEELVDYEWKNLSLVLTRYVVPFKREVYRNVIRKIRPILEDIIKTRNIIKKK